MHDWCYTLVSVVDQRIEVAINTKSCKCIIVDSERRTIPPFGKTEIVLRTPGGAGIGYGNSVDGYVGLELVAADGRRDAMLLEFHGAASTATGVTARPRRIRVGPQCVDGDAYRVTTTIVCGHEVVKGVAGLVVETAAGTVSTGVWENRGAGGYATTVVLRVPTSAVAKDTRLKLVVRAPDGGQLGVADLRLEL